MKDESVGAAGRPAEECDLVMKGGVTSGVVYPSAMKEIARRYRLRNVGGASAGAIAAIAGAACEYRRNEGDPNAFERLDEVQREITQQGFVLQLFQPTERARPGFGVALGLVTSKGGKVARATATLRAILAGRPLFVLVAVLLVLLWAALLALAAWAFAAGGWRGLEIAAFAVLALTSVAGLVALLAVATGVALLRFGLELNTALCETWFGMCTGRTEAGYPDGSGLTDWLHGIIQRCAGLPPDRPLTFRMLQGPNPEDPLVNLQLVTTDLSFSRPVTLPLAEPEDEEAPYLFDPEELGRLFPPEVVEQMRRATEAHGARTFETEPGRTFLAVPGLDLPILVAARLSLSFPMLLATVPLWKDDPGVKGVVQHTMSDGGITSNFPIHFFDALFPGRPTFGLDLQPWRIADLPAVDMSDDPRPPQFSKVTTLGGFWTRLLNAARNWRDNMQAELPGYRDRICQIRLTAKEGGLNLDMDERTVADLVRRGRDAGALVAGDRFDWDRHRATRYRTFMQMLQRGLGQRGAGRPCVYWSGKCDGRVPFRDLLQGCEAEARPPAAPPEWCETAMAATDGVLSAASQWGPGGPIDFDEGAPLPTPAIRIVPRA